MYRSLLYISLGVALAFGPLPSAVAATIVGSFDWNDVTDQGWTEDQDWVTLSSPGSGGVDNTGYLNMKMAATGAFPPADGFALVTTPASGLFAGAWQPDMWVEFDFWAEDIAPEYVQVRWAGDDGTVWRSTVFDSTASTMQTQTWSHLSSPSFTDYAKWDYGGGSQEDFVNDLSSMDWIGVYVWRNTGDEQNYGIDNFNLMVPEPSEYAMILASAVCMILSVGRKRDWLTRLRLPASS